MKTNMNETNNLKPSTLNPQPSTLKLKPSALKTFPPFYYLCNMVEIKLKKGKEKAVHQRHPWVFSGAIENVEGKPANGDVVKLLSASNDFLAYLK